MIINGDALTVLKRMDSESVHMAVTSSPYYGLRAYGTEPQIWDGDPNCQHEWGMTHPP
jgi:DNA modification methylase